MRDITGLERICREEDQRWLKETRARIKKRWGKQAIGLMTLFACYLIGVAFIILMMGP